MKTPSTGEKGKMREIKFRAWNPKTGLMATPYYIVNKSGEWGVQNWEGIAGKSLTSHFTKVIMQYTGLKDKNNVEIYEGDIVRGIDGWKDKKYEKSSNFLPELYSIAWENSGLVAINEAGEYTYLNSYWWEVIGNIYENPELLTKESTP